MRWSMVPVSAAAHAAAVLGFVIIPMAADIELPSPWPLGPPSYVVAAAVPVPVPLQVTRATAVPTTAAPISPADRIEKPEPLATLGPVVDGALPADALGGTGVSAIVPAVPAPPPPAPPVTVQRPATVRPGGTIREPRKVVDVPPVYPEIARAVRVEGLVIVEATIDERGVVTDARVLRSVPLLDGAALDALKQWRYTPTLLNGVPVRVLMTVTFRFTLADRNP